MNKYALALLAVGLAGWVSAADTPNMTPGLWEITNQAQMSGAQIPAQTSKVCFTQDDIARGAMLNNQGNSGQKCETVSSNYSGNKMSYKIVCSGKEKVTINGETTFSASSFQGSSQTDMVSNGQTIKISSSFSAKRVGDCKK